uniref:Uncharacterized protein n=1 Tax=Takifugu rubripes TaxID=31033 RepID=A0A674P9G5_TAKRU
ITREASFSARDAFISPSAAITLNRKRAGTSAAMARWTSQSVLLGPLIIACIYFSHYTTDFLHNCWLSTTAEYGQCLSAFSKPIYTLINIVQMVYDVICWCLI